ncbi:MAG: NADH-quinone oxidoreductase subunit L [Acidimicrobiia bacterium]|nr:NADH-quinone oxidoreductase subunit L [Acidimicrobiia bacterium]
MRHGRAWLGPVVVASLLGSLGTAVLAAISGARSSWSWGAGIDLGVEVVGVGRVMVVLVPLVAVVVVSFAASSMRDDEALARLLALLAAFVAAMELLVMAADFLTLLIGWELVGAASWSLISHDWRNAQAPMSAKEAFVTTRFGDLGLYVAAGAAFASVGTFQFADLAAGPNDRWLAIVAGGVVLAAAAKSAQLPFSPWLFSAMAGPTPVSALLHSATMVAAGAYALIRLEPILSAVSWFGPLVVGLGLSTALAGGVVAFAQSDLKRALAGSTSAQYGLMLVATGAGFTAAGMGQLTAHAFFKALLFLGAGVALHGGGTLDLAKLRLGSSLPTVALLFGVGAAGLAAVPPLGAAFTKEAVLAAAFESGVWVGSGVVVAGLLSVLYAARLHVLAYGRGPVLDIEVGPHPVEVWALAVLAVFTLALSAIWLPGGKELVSELTGADLPAGQTWELTVSVLSVVVGFVVVWLLWRRNSLLSGGLPSRIRGFLANWWGIPGLTRRAVVDPLIKLSNRLAEGDGSVIDALVRAIAGSVVGVSHRLRDLVEILVDRVVDGVGGGTILTATGSQKFDDDAVDATVEAIGAGIRFGGDQTRRSQTGMAHHYYTLLVGGSVVLFIVAAIWR